MVKFSNYDTYHDKGVLQKNNMKATNKVFTYVGKGKLRVTAAERAR